MKWFHLIFGVIVFGVFVTTGKFMRVDFPDKDMIPQDLRLLMRSRHIYILFSAFIHLMLGVYLQIRPSVWQKIFQYGGSAVLIASSVLLTWVMKRRSLKKGRFAATRANTMTTQTSAA